jgi:superfamily II DNA or RNA helicase
MKNVKISIQFTNHYKLAVSISDTILLDSLKRYCETKDMIVFKTKGKNPVLRRELKISVLWVEKDEESILIDAGLIDYLVTWVGGLDKDEYDIDLSLDIPQVNPVVLNDRWNGILRDDQKEDVLKLTRFYNGLAAQHTGYGKTLCMLSIVECLPGRSVILVPNSGILSEVQLRGEQFGVVIPHYRWSGSRDILNPVGFLRANESKKNKASAWLEGVENVFTDEAHYLQANSWTTVFDTFLPNVKRAYGFSASPDSKNGKHLTPGEMQIRDLGYRSAKIIGLSGTTRVKRKSKAEMTLVEVTSQITPEKHDPPENWQEALDLMIKRPECARVISEVIKKYPTVKFYIPVHKIESGRMLFDQIQRYGVKGVFWRAGETVPESDSKEDTLSFIKRHVVKDEYRFLMTTSVGFEGVDMPSLSGVIPLTGKSYRLVMQPAGRSSRGDTLMYVLIHDKHNRVMKNQTAERKRTITREYDVVKSVRLSL